MKLKLEKDKGGYY